MNDKRILVINHYAGSPDMGMEFRPYYFAKEWVKKGYQVSIIAADFSHLRRNNPEVTKDFTEEVIDGIHYYWVKTGKYEGNGIKRAITMFQFVGKIWLNANRIVKIINPTVIITSSTYPLDTYAGQKIKQFKSEAKLIHEIHDMWPISPIEIGGMSPMNPFIWIMQRAEDSFCKKSDKVVSLLPCASGYLQEHGMDAKKFIHVANGIVEEEWTNADELPKDVQGKLAEIKTHHRKVICFFGSHTKSYALDYIIEAVNNISEKEIALLMVGGGVYKNNLMKKAENISNVYFMDSISKKCVPSLLKQIDYIYIGAVRDKMFRFGICMNKLFDSMMAGKPILYAVDAPNNYIERYNCGITVESENTEALVNGLNKLLKMIDEDVEKMGANGRNAVVNNFTISKLADKFSKEF